MADQGPAQTLEDAVTDAPREPVPIVVLSDFI